MQYLGGKSRLGGQIVRAILSDLGVSRLTLAADLCSGAGGVTHRLADVSDRVIAVEAHLGLVSLMRAVQGGWVPPEHVSEEEYKALRVANDPTIPLTAFAEFGCSFGGKSWRGYARQPSTGHNFARAGSQSIRKRARANVEHVAADALAWEPVDGLDVAYCDPPYEGTTGYSAVAPAPKGAWWRKMKSIADRGIAAYLSEYAERPPTGVAARLVWEAPSYKSLAHNYRNRERLWRVLSETVARSSG